MRPLVVGFDLDMTLVDSRRGVGAALAALARETGRPIDTAAATSRLGPPLETELAHWFPADEVAAAADRYRELYPTVAIAPTPALPGAAAALAAVRRHGGRTVVVTAKHAPSARAHLDHLGLPADVVVGQHWGPAKGLALREHGASVYVGDHVSDVVGALAAGAVPVAVPSGPVPAAELAAAGAAVVLPSLVDFPDWLDGHVRWLADAPGIGRGLGPGRDRPGGPEGRNNGPSDQDQALRTDVVPSFGSDDLAGQARPGVRPQVSTVADGHGVWR